MAEFLSDELLDHSARWHREVRKLKVDAEHLAAEEPPALSSDLTAPRTAFIDRWDELAYRWLSLCWPALSPAVIISSCVQSLETGHPVLDSSAAPLLPLPVKPLQAKAKPAPLPRVKKQADPLPDPDPEPEPLPAITEEQWEAPPEPAAEPEPPAAEPEPTPEPPAAAERGEWVLGSRLAELLHCSPSAVSADRRDGVFDGCWREPLPNEGKGIRYNVEACRAAQNSKQDRRKSRPKRPRLGSITPDKLAADPELQQQLEALLAAVRGES